MADMDTDELLAAYIQWERAADDLASRREMLELLRGVAGLPGGVLTAEVEEMERLHAHWVALSAPLAVRRA